MNVLSLFDGMSCGQLAFEKSKININNYFASEIDKHAIKATQYNYPKTIQLGDVKKLKLENLPKIDILIGGSPCQDFSPARAFGNNGLSPQGLQGEKSSLFYEYLNILNYLKIKNKNLIFLLENVKMKKKSKLELDNYLGVNGININSSLLSFQRRDRYYWTNLNIEIPKDKNISFQSFKEQGEHLKKYKLNKTKSRIRMWSNGLGTNSKGSCANITDSDKIYCLTTKQDRCPNSGLIEYEDFCRFLSQKELELAQTVPIGYTSCLSYNQACAVLGNGWTVDVISHIFNYI